jgi:hypothetical protein
LFFFEISENKYEKIKKVPILKIYTFICVQMVKFLKNKLYLHNLAY